MAKGSHKQRLELKALRHGREWRRKGPAVRFQGQGCEGFGTEVDDGAPKSMVGRCDVLHSVVCLLELAISGSVPPLSKVFVISDPSLWPGALPE